MWRAVGTASSPTAGQSQQNASIESYLQLYRAVSCRVGACAYYFHRSHSRTMTHSSPETSDRIAWQLRIRALGGRPPKHVPDRLVWLRSYRIACEYLQHL